MSNQNIIIILVIVAIIGFFILKNKQQPVVVSAPDSGGGSAPVPQPQNLLQTGVDYFKNLITKQPVPVTSSVAPVSNVIQTKPFSAPIAAPQISTQPTYKSTPVFSTPPNAPVSVANVPFVNKTNLSNPISEITIKKLPFISNPYITPVKTFNKVIPLAAPKQTEYSLFNYEL